MMPYPLKNLTKDNTLIIYKILRILSTVYVQIINMKLISYETQRTIGIVKYIFLTINQTLGNKTQQTPFHAFWMYMDISKMNLLALLIVIIWLPLNPRLFFRILLYDYAVYLKMSKYALEMRARLAFAKQAASYAAAKSKILHARLESIGSSWTNDEYNIYFIQR